MRIAERLKVRLAEAAGLYDNVLLGFGEHQKDGNASEVSDRSLELWAVWEGTPGRFAKAFREICVIQSEEEIKDVGDAVGKVKGWMRRQWKLLQKQMKDAAKRRPTKRSSGPGEGANGGPPKTREGTREGFQGVPPKNPLGNPEKKESHVTSSTEIPVRDPSQLMASTAATLGVRPRRPAALQRAGAAPSTSATETLH